MREVAILCYAMLYYLINNREARKVKRVEQKLTDKQNNEETSRTVDRSGKRKRELRRERKAEEQKVFRNLGDVNSDAKLRINCS